MNGSTCGARRPKLANAAGLLLVAALLALAVGCSSSSSPAIVPAGISAGFAPSGTAAAADSVRLTGSSVGDLATVSVAIGGPTTSSDLYSFAFDLLLSDPAVAEYVGGSAEFGTALTTGLGQSPQVLATQNGGRVTVGVTKLGGGAGNSISSGEPAIVSLTFRMLQEGTSTITLVGGPSSSPAALDSTGAVIPSVTFDAQTAMLSGS